MILQPDKLQSKPTKKPRLNGLALAFQNPRPGQSRHEAVITARLGLARLTASGRARHSTAHVLDLVSNSVNAARGRGHLVCFLTEQVVSLVEALDGYIDRNMMHSFSLCPFSFSVPQLFDFDVITLFLPLWISV
jgi:hypothetical protein